MVLTSTTTDTVVIGEKMLVPTSRYRMRLYVTLDGASGFAEDELFINQPPHGGECQIGKKSYLVPVKGENNMLAYQNTYEYNNT